MKEMFKLGLVSNMFFKDMWDSKDEYFNAITHIASLDEVEIIEIPSPPKDHMDEVVSILEGKQIIYCAQPTLAKHHLSLCTLNEDDRQKAISLMQNEVQVAHQLNSKLIIFGSGEFEGLEDKQFHLFVDSVTRLCDYAKNYGIKLALEPFDRVVDKKFLIGNNLLVTKLMERIGSSVSNFCINVDLAHIPQIGESPVETLKVLKPYIGHIHVGNCVLDESSEIYGDKHPSFKYQGEIGEQELVDFMQTAIDVQVLSQSSDVNVSIEARPHYNDDSREIISENIAFFKNAFAKVPHATRYD